MPTLTPARRIPAKWQKLLLQIPGYDSIATAQEAYFVPRIAQDALDFFPECLKHIEGDLYGKPFILEPWQQSIIANLFGWYQLDEKGREVRRYREMLLYVPKKGGKALALDTPIPTPKGWRTMGELTVGDEVFDEHGLPSAVIATSEVMHDHQCYEVCFSDGERIVADAEHLWATHTRKPENGRKIWTTEQIASTVFWGRSKRGGRNHSIPVAGPLQLSEQELPIPPYVLGAWLGDGNTTDPRITLHQSDAEILTYLGEHCLLGPIRPELRNPNVVRVSLGILSPSQDNICQRGHDQSRWRSPSSRHCRRCEQMTDYARRHDLPLPSYKYFYFGERARELGLYGNKHIPPTYLRGSLSQRLALLQGLLDTDGSIDARGHCEFSTILPSLRDGIMELLRSLGFKPTCTTARARVNGKDCGEVYRVRFHALAERAVFRLARKRRRQMPATARQARSQTRQIVAVNPVPSVPVKCIGVDSPSHLYLAGRGMIPTHNTPICAGVNLLVLFCRQVDGEMGQQNYIAAADKLQAGKLFRYAQAMVKAEPELLQRCRIYGGNASAGQTKSIVIEGENSFLQILSADADTKEGNTSHLVTIDELHVQPDRRLVDSLTTSLASENRKQPLVIYLTTADYDRPSICNEVYDRAVRVRDGLTVNPRFLPIIYEAPKVLNGVELDYTDPAVYRDPKIWAIANPNLGVSVSRAYLEADSQKAFETPGYLPTFLRLHLNVRTSTSSSWLDMQRWDASAGEEVPAIRMERDDEAPPDRPYRLAMPVGSVPDRLRKRQCWAGLDLGSTSDLTSLCLEFPEEDGTYQVLWWNWVPEQTAKKRANKGDVAYLDFIQRGYLLTTPGDETDYETILQQINAIGQEYGIVEIAADRNFQGAQLCQDLVKAGFDVVPWNFSTWHMAAPTDELERLVNRGAWHHGGNPVARWAAGHTIVTTDNNGNRKPDKARSADKIDPVISGIIGLGLAMLRQKPEESVYNSRGLLVI